MHLFLHASCASFLAFFHLVSSQSPFGSLGSSLSSEQGKLPRTPSSIVLPLKHFTPKQFFDSLRPPRHTSSIPIPDLNISPGSRTHVEIVPARRMNQPASREHVQVVQLGPIKWDVITELKSQETYVEDQRIICGLALFHGKVEVPSDEGKILNHCTTNQNVQCGPTRHVSVAGQTLQSSGILLSTDEACRTSCACILSNCLSGRSCASSLIILHRYNTQKRQQELERWQWSPEHLGASDDVTKWIDSATNFDQKIAKITMPGIDHKVGTYEAYTAWTASLDSESSKAKTSLEKPGSKRKADQLSMLKSGESVSGGRGTHRTSRQGRTGHMEIGMTQ